MVLWQLKNCPEYCYLTINLDSRPLTPHDRPGSRVDAAFSLNPPAIIVAPLRSKAQELEAVYVSLGVSSRRAIVNICTVAVASSPSLVTPRHCSQQLEPGAY